MDPPLDPIVWLDGVTEQVGAVVPPSQLMTTLDTTTFGVQVPGPFTVIVRPNVGAEATAPPMKATAASKRPNEYSNFSMDYLEEQQTESCDCATQASRQHAD